MELRSRYQKNDQLENNKKPSLKNQKVADCFFLTIQKLCEIAILSRSIVYVHKTKQNDRSLAENPEMASDVAALSRFLPVGTEDNRSFHKIKLESILKNFLSEEKQEWLSKAANLSSSDRTPFADIKSPTYLWAGSSFDDLFYSTLMGNTRVFREEDIINPTSFVSKIVIDENSSMGKSEISCSHRINAIVGPSGSGKTLLLDLIKRKLSGEPLTEKTSSVAGYDKLCELSCIHLYNSVGSELNTVSGYKVVELENLYQRIIKAYSSKQSDISAILDDLGLSVDDNEFQKK